MQSRNWTKKIYQIGDRIKGLKLRHFAKLNFTSFGKLWRRSVSPTLSLCEGAAVDEPQKTRDSIFYLGASSTAAPSR